MKVYLVSGAVLAVILCLCGMVYHLGSPQGPDLAQVAHLRQPRFTTLPDQRVLLVTATGDPNVIGKRAFGLLMRVYYRLDGVPKGGAAFQAPRARWPKGFETPKEQWIGRYAIPVPATVAALPAVGAEPGMTVALASWTYGDVAEILHVGRYDRESPTIARLKAFIQAHGYVIAGDHEEEYLKGPGMLFSGDPTGYLTIIRYQVRRKAVDPGPPEAPATQN
jgi:hypothetical protein